MNHTEKKIRLCITLLILNLIFIWGNSLLPGSVSGSISRGIREFADWLLQIEREPASGGSNGLRKLAHLGEFFSLGLLLSWLFSMKKKPFWYGILPGILTACLDESIQMFVPGRGPGIMDVMIDSFGLVLGVCIFTFGSRIYQKQKKTMEENNL